MVWFNTLLFCGQLLFNLFGLKGRPVVKMDGYTMENDLRIFYRNRSIVYIQTWVDSLSIHSATVLTIKKFGPHRVTPATAESHC